MTGSGERLPRLLALVPYLLNHPGVTIDQTAHDFGVGAAQLRKDLKLLWLCGLPGYGPGDLIDLSFDGDTVSVVYDAGMRRPLRLTTAEASVLVVALQMLTEIPGAVWPAGSDSSGIRTDGDAVRRAITKIETASGAAHSSHVVVEHGIDENEQTTRTREAVREALDGERALWLRYYTASKDRMTERTVDPMRLLILYGIGYLEAWCREAEGVRFFRLDRIDDFVALDERATYPPTLQHADVSEGVFSPDPAYPEAVLVLDPEARWVAEYYPCDEVTERESGRLQVRMRYGDESWMVRLVLGLGGNATVQQPVRLAEAVRRRAVEALALAARLPAERNR